MKRKVIQAGVLFSGFVLILMGIQMLKFGTPNGYIIFGDEGSKFLTFRFFEAFSGGFFLALLSLVALALVYLFVSPVFKKKDVSHGLFERPSRQFIDINQN